MKYPEKVSAPALHGPILNDMLINMDGNTFNGQLTSEVVTC